MTKNKLNVIWCVIFIGLGSYWAYQKRRLSVQVQRKIDMKEQQGLYENGFESKYGTKPGCDGEGKCGLDSTSGMSLQKDVKKQFKSNQSD
jgi:hypothetical protein